MNPSQSLCKELNCLQTCTDAWYSGYPNSGADKGPGDMQSVLCVLVLYYGLAVRERMTAQPAAALRAWLEAPGSRQNREFCERLYVQLVNDGKISIPPGL